jgi:hypothetical protein
VPSVLDECITAFRTIGDAEYNASFLRAAGTLDAFSGRVAGLDRQKVAARVGFDLARQALSFFGDAAVAAADDQEEFNRASRNLKGALDPAQIAAWAASMQELTGIDDERFARVAGILGTFQVPADSAKELTRGVFDAAESLKALGFSAETTANAVGKAIQTGQATGLRRIGIVVDQAQFATAQTEAERTRLVMGALEKQGGQAAVAFRDSLPGAIQAFNSSLHSAQENIGAAETGPFRLLVETGKSAVDAFNALPGPVIAAGATLGVVGAGALAVYTGGTLLALNNTIRLAEAHLRAAGAAGVQAAAETRLGGVLAAGAGAGPGAGSGAAQRAGAASWLRSLGGPGAGAGTAVGAAGAVAAVGTAERGLFGLPAGANRFIGPGLAAGALGAGAFVLSQVPRTGGAGANEGRDVGQGFLTGAATGVGLGMFLGPEGALAGGLIGGAGGAAGAFLQNMGQQDAEAKAAAAAAKAVAPSSESDKDRQLTKLQEIVDELKGIRRGQTPLDPTDLPVRDQWEAILGTA